jgi:hypothetical protein
VSAVEFHPKGNGWMVRWCLRDRQDVLTLLPTRALAMENVRAAFREGAVYFFTGGTTKPGMVGRNVKVEGWIPIAQVTTVYLQPVSDEPMPDEAP